MFFTPHQKIPTQAKVTCGNFLCDLRPLNPETHQVRLTAGGDHLNHKDNPSLPAVYLLDIKFISTVSFRMQIKGYATARRIFKFYLNNAMQKIRYMKVPIYRISEEIHKEYHLDTLVYKGFVFIEIRKEIYGLKDTGIIAYITLVNHLAPLGYFPV